MEKKTTNRSVRRPGTRYVGLDLKDSVYDELSEIAQKDQRPLASLIRVILDQYLRVYNSDETLMPMHKIMGPLPMKRDFEDHTIADLKNSDVENRERESLPMRERLRNVAKTAGNE